MVSLLLGNLRMRKKIPREQHLWTRCQSVVPNDVPRDFGPVIAFGAKVQIPVTRQGGREMSAPRPYVTDPFLPLSSILKLQQFLYIFRKKLKENTRADWLIIVFL